MNLLLDYRREPLRKPIIETGDDSVQITFPVLPKWLVILPIIIVFCAAIMPVLAAAQAYQADQLYKSLLAPLPVDSQSRQFLEQADETLRLSLLINGCHTTVWLACGTFMLWKYRRWGRVPRVLRVDAKKVTLTFLGLLTMREKQWPIEQFLNVQLVATLNWKLQQQYITLQLNRRSGQPMRFSLSTTERSEIHKAVAVIARLIPPSLKDGNFVGRV